MIVLQDMIKIQRLLESETIYYSERCTGPPECPQPTPSAPVPPFLSLPAAALGSPLLSVCKCAVLEVLMP